MSAAPATASSFEGAGDRHPSGLSRQDNFRICRNARGRASEVLSLPTAAEILLAVTQAQGR